MEPSQTEVESMIIELAESSFKTFCDDISGMFGIDMECSQQEVTPETVNGLRTRFNDLVVAYSVKAEGAFDGTFQFVFDQNGLFILAGVIAMHPEQLILESTKFASLEKAEKVSDILKEIGAALAGAWDRILRKGLDGHRVLVQTNTFIGNPWDKSEEKIGLSGDEELVFVPYEMTVGSFPAFKCGTIFPKAIFADTPESGTEQPASDEEKNQKENEKGDPNVSEAVQETEEKAQEEIENTALNLGEGAEEPESRDPNVSEAGKETDQKAQEETKEEAEDQKTAVDKVDSDESDTAQKSDSEISESQEPADGMAAVEQAKDEKDDNEQAAQAEEGDATAEQPQPEAEETIAIGESATEQEPEAAAEQKPKDVEEVISTTIEIETRQERPISEAIQKMTRSSAELPAESTPSAMEGKPALSSKETHLELCAKDIMQKDVLWANPNDSVQKALAKIQQHDAGYMLIGREQVPEGIISKSDLSGALSPYLRTIFAKWRRPLDDATLQIKIKWIMSKPTRTIRPDTPLTAIMENMCQSGIRCLPVVDEQGKVRGLVTVFDIFKALLKHPSRK